MKTKSLTIDIDYPSPKDFLSLELATLRYIKDNPVFQSYHNQFATAADLAYHQTKPAKKRLLPLSFESELNIVLDKKSDRKGQAILGADIQLNRNHTYEKVSFSLAICENKEPKNRLVRRYHFDYAMKGSVVRQPHPVFHMQYAGELSPYLQSLNLDHSHIDSWLSEPRLVYMPMSLALLINFVFKEFNDETNQRIVESSDWRQLIRKNESHLLAPYFKCCHTFLQTGSDPNNLLTVDFCYGN